MEMLRLWVHEGWLPSPPADSMIGMDVMGEELMLEMGERSPTELIVLRMIKKNQVKELSFWKRL